MFLDISALVLILWSALLASSQVFGHPSTAIKKHSMTNLSFDVTRFGAVGNGKTYDTRSAWKAACSKETNNVKITVPEGKTFLVRAVKFEGPCKSSSITFEILGRIVAPPRSAWRKKTTDDWLYFNLVDGLIIDGSGQGQIDGVGLTWWKHVKLNKKTKGKRDSRPTAMRFSKCNGLQLRGLKFINSQGSHIAINACNKTSISKLDISAPQKSPNTDGIDISSSNDLHIHDCVIATGDDCIAINGGTSDIDIANISCGPGHGISIGSLGKKGHHDEVERINITNCSFNRTQNGVRIKTWQGGAGFAKNIIFSNITFIKANNPVIIDQFYCPHSKCNIKKSAVQVSNVRFSGLKGTSSCQNATINLSCSSTVPCKNIILEDVNIKSANPLNNSTSAYCINAHGLAHKSNPVVNCLTSVFLPYFSILLLALLELSVIGRARETPIWAYSNGPISSLRRSPSSSPESAVDVTHFGAVGDGKTDDSNAFKLAWEAACREVHSDSAKVTVPFGKTFLLSPISFQGPCNSSSLTFEILGTIVAPPKEEWKIKTVLEWLMFQGVDRLRVIGNGQGIIDGQGATWWDDVNSARPTALLFSSCNHLEISGLKHINSQKFHLSMKKCDNANISKLQMIAPSTSPNTDGIDVGDSTNVTITNCIMETGDDCIAIKPGSSNINISDIACGPGHGISIGSLEKNNQVEGISVSNCTFNGTQNGIRIKTYQGGSGFARNIKFTQINFKDTYNPVVIDQFYCPHSTCPIQTSAVKVSNVTFQGLRGTTPSKDTSVNLRCSDTVPCTNILLDDLHILSNDTQEKTMSSCNNAYGVATNAFSPSVNCLLSEH
ncbi:hypothetical protein CASFOL_024785 [Castilleja foliolosa]|uniref:Polygalacturonase n=1 Tax=Castilleja foliolosa TaxID=1961234 RepID=A0ABD3CR71_9LAMI